jgi:hypothetical protein
MHIYSEPWIKEGTDRLSKSSIGKDRAGRGADKAQLALRAGPAKADIGAIGTEALS